MMLIVGARAVLCSSCPPAPAVPLRSVAPPPAAALLAAALLATALSPGCAEPRLPPAGDWPHDAESGDLGERDARSEDARAEAGALPDSGLGSFGEPCRALGDCLSGYCVEGDDGRVCTRACNDDCPAGWDCRELINEGGDVVYICMPQRVLCTPCQDARGCGETEENLCLAIGDGTYCARDCRERDCPPGYRCSTVEEAGPEERQCLPESGWCTPCRDEDGDGHRGGEQCPDPLDCDDHDARIYRGAAERCDGRDNDCDGSTDEGFDFAGDPQHCGGCDRACAFPHGVPGCSQGECRLDGCEPGWLDCNERDADGCEQPCQQTHGGSEVCDELDNDCDCRTDEDFDLLGDPAHCSRCARACPEAGCAAGRQGYVAWPASSCAQGECTEVEQLSCGLYTCAGGGAEGDRCAMACAEDDDGLCLSAAHCAGGECVPDLPAGAPCRQDRQCLSGHCANGFCCLDGLCCGVVADCPAGMTRAPTCDLPSACQGSRGEPVCDPEHRCVARAVEDDSACGPETVADGCGAFPSVHCNGQPIQVDPPCPDLCGADEDCDPGAHCDDGTCRGDLPDGENCNEDSDCLSGYCGNGFCCADLAADGTTDCCAAAHHCPDGHYTPPTCAEPAACQGFRRDPTCTEHVCGQSEQIDDDRGCTAEQISDDCGLFAPVTCTGQEQQQDPLCPEACHRDEDCDRAAHCDLRLCLPDLPDGQPCDEASDCASGYCGNGFCCADGDCCGQAADCPPLYRREPACERPSSCQGARSDALCTAASRCATQRVEDDSACTPAVLASACGYFGDRFCSGAAVQAEPACPLECLSDEECDPGAHCDDVCQPDLDDGRPCDEDGDCRSGHCANGFCCRAGDCCAVPASCPAAYREEPVCDDATTCQGHRSDAVCRQAICGMGPPVDDDTGCRAGLLADACAAFPAVRCTGELAQAAPRCAAACADDGGCDAEAHCDDGACYPDLPDGARCDEDSDCVAGHCGNGFCCRLGDCCAVAADCPAAVYVLAPLCDRPRLCQGSRLDARCTAERRCASQAVEDDTACSPAVRADGCGYFADRWCTGAASQPEPACLGECLLDEDCDDGAHCDVTCQPDLPDGRICDEDSDCASGHCGNGFCCRAGDCCAAPDSCPAAYREAPVCDDPRSCQGHRRDATCLGSICALGPVIDDDRACAAGRLSDACGLYPAVFCTGEVEQEDPPCVRSCAGDLDCDPEAHCDQGTCQGDLPDGRPCLEDSDCASNHCGNDFCCGEGDCCAVAADCPAGWRAAPRCEQPGACQGSRVDAQCGADFRCRSTTVADDSACTRLTLSDACGFFADVYCTGLVEQQDPSCPALCALDADCDGAAHCDETCLPDLPDGRVCDEDSDCASGHCGNGFCCRAGDCCIAAASCPPRYTLAPVCDVASSCQGHRQKATCLASTCGTSEPIADDRGCTAGLLADECGLYPAVRCTGESDQLAPACPVRCAVDADCDREAHCFQGACRRDLADGEACGADTHCAGGHCGNGFCCRAGDCCGQAAHCPAGYRQAPLCERPSACQGNRVDALCDEDHRCRSLSVDDDSACSAQVLSDGCGYFADVFCSGARIQNDPPCPGSCMTDDKCDDGAHCDGTCQPDAPDGQACDEDSDCLSGHCANGFCCRAGDCCAVAAGCPARYRLSPVCDAASTCQGHRLDATCIDSICGTSPRVDDDRGCGAGLLSDGCGLYPAVHCTGEAVQQDPPCPQQCAADEGCDPGAHCDEGECRSDLADGQRCDEDSDCQSGHCGNGFCCRAGDCCALAADCPPAYASPPRCDRPSACQGSRLDAVCDEERRCRSRQVDDDSACTAQLLSDACGFFQDVYCNGGQNQQDPPCPAVCAVEGDCDPGAHCDVTCLPDLADGRVCDEDSDCASGHCANSYCCAAGDCCAAAADCPARYRQSPVCDTVATCQGHRRDALCDGNVCGTSAAIDDDRGCVGGLVANACGLYPAVHCTGAAVQLPPVCPDGCFVEEDCDPGAHCRAGVCQGDLGDGQPCLVHSDCISNHCGNGFCCTQGDCCGVAADCPPAYRAAPRCEQPSACQGSRVDALCNGNRCSSLLQQDDSACSSEVLSDDCGFFGSVFCNGQVVQQDPPCPQACATDAQCDPGAHCDGTCLADLADGRRCDEDSDCQSGHCGNGFCCRGGDCCGVAADCPARYAVSPSCDSAATCQGHRHEPTCLGSVCGTSDPVADDRGCSAGMVSDECGLYLAVTCTGQAEQQDPPCPVACLQDAECDQPAHCDGTCLADQPDGQPCDEASDCSSGYCNNGFCCQGGTCCGLAADCPAAFFAPAQCVTPGSCQGSRVDAVCREDRRCASLTVDDDSACTAQLLSDACGFYRDRYCTGAATQQDPPCPVACQQDGDCDADAHCDGTCLADLANGQPCDEHSDCRSSHCQNRFCCAAGDCCQLASDCPAAYRADPVCDSAASCQGHRVDALCGAQDHRCSSSAAIADDRGCGQGLLSDACGLYPAVYCTGAAEQQDPPCPIRCASDAECDPGAHCDGGACLSDQPPGQPCDEPSDCAAGLTCVDGVCCTSACNGLCERCDLSGDGTCLPVPRGQDPSNECGALSCNGYFAGFAGSECRERADLAAAAVACNGAGACQTAAELCPRQGAGDTVLSCHPTCQQPVANSCQGTTPGACNNVNPGSVSCGIGQCTNTVPRCVNGALNVCTPLPAGLEVCNGLDDDCDGWTDAADGDLGTNDRPLCENQTGVCQGSRKPPALCSGGAWQRCSSAEYAAFAGALYQTPAETSCDGRDNDCDGAVDELVGSDVNNCGSCGTVCSNPHGTTSCIAGQCTPVCVGLWGSCDGNRINGCEAALTTLVNCGSCGTPCALANAAESCADGTCRLTSCDAGYGNCDGVTANGCEEDLTPASATCANAVQLDSMCGDRESGFLCPANRVDGPSRTGRGERWYKVLVQECSDCPSTLQINAWLQSPAGMDYDLYLYDSCGGQPVARSTNGTGQLDSVTDTEGDDWGSSDSRWWYIKVHYFGGTVCSDWALDVCGGRGCP